MSRWARRGSVLVGAFAVLALITFSSAPLARAGQTAGARPEDGSPPPPGANDWQCKPPAAHPNPVVLVHGLGATMSENWSYLSPLLAQQGYCVFALTYGERPDFPMFGGVLPMEQSSVELDDFVRRVLGATGASKIDLVGHSEGTVMPQYWLKRLGGAAFTDRYVALTPLYDGTTVYGLSTAVNTLSAANPSLAAQLGGFFDGFCGSCREFLNGSAFLTDLYRDGKMAPGVTYTTVMTKFDELVVPWQSGYLPDPATNVVLQDLCPLDLSEHGAVAFDPVVARVVLNALDPASAVAPRCSPTGVSFGPLGP